MAVWDQPVYGLKASPSRLRISGIPDLPGTPPYTLRPAFPFAGWSTLLRHPIVQTLSNRYRNIRLFPITYAFQPRLRGRLTLGGLPFPRKPWVFGEPVSHRLYRYSCQHSHFHTVHRSFRSSFNQYGTLPYHPFPTEVEKRSAASVTDLSPVTFSAQNHLTSELLRFL